MSIEHLKKQSKNLKRLWPEFAETHGASPSLAACQELIARCSGYASWHAAVGHETVGSTAAASKAHKEDDGALVLRKTIRALLSCWPDSSFAVARRARVTGNQLDAYVSGQHIFDGTELKRVREELNIVNERRQSLSDGSTIYGTEGCYVLYPSGQPSDFIGAYEELCRGGDAQFCSEVKPMSGPQDAARRLILMLGFETDALFVVERGSVHERVLTDQMLVNIAPLAMPLPNTVYEVLIKLASAKLIGHKYIAIGLRDTLSRYGVVFDRLRHS